MILSVKEIFKNIEHYVSTDWYDDTKIHTFEFSIKKRILTKDEDDKILNIDYKEFYELLKEEASKEIHRYMYDDLQKELDAIYTELLIIYGQETHILENLKKIIKRLET